MAEEVEVRVKIDGSEAEKSLGNISNKIAETSKKTKEYEANQKDLGKEILGNSKLTDGLSKATGGMSDTFFKATKGVKLTNLSLKGLKGAIMSTGIGALVILVGELVSALAEFYSSEKQSEKAVNDLTYALEGQADAFDELTDRNKFFNQLQLRQDKANGASKEQLKKTNDDYLQSEKKRIEEELVLLELEHMAVLKNDKLNEEDRAKAVADVNAQIKKLQNAKITNNRDKLQADSDYYIAEKEEAKKAEQDKIAKQKVYAEKKAQEKKAEQDKIKALELKYKLDIENLEDDTDQKKLDRQKLRAEQELNQLKTSAEQKLALQKQIDQDFALRQKELNDKEAEEKKKRDEEADKLELEKKTKAREEKLLGVELELEEEQLSFEQKRELLMQREGVLLEDEKLTANQRKQIQADTTEALNQLDEIQYQNKVALLGATANALASASEVIGKETAVGKGIALASALMNTYQGITAGVKLGYPQAIPAVAMASLTGFGAVKNILSVKVPKGGGGGAGAGASISAPSKAMPSFNVVGNSGVNQIAQTLGAQQPVKAYVVASNVTTQQSLDRNIVNNASLG
jgi:hypothetical protein